MSIPLSRFDSYSSFFRLVAFPNLFTTCRCATLSPLTISLWPTRHRCFSRASGGSGLCFAVSPWVVSARSSGPVSELLASSVLLPSCINDSYIPTSMLVRSPLHHDPVPSHIPQVRRKEAGRLEEQDGPCLELARWWYAFLNVPCYL